MTQLQQQVCAAALKRNFYDDSNQINDRFLTCYSKHCRISWQLVELLWHFERFMSVILRVRCELFQQLRHHVTCVETKIERERERERANKQGKTKVLWQPFLHSRRRGRSSRRTRSKKKLLLLQSSLWLSSSSFLMCLHTIRSSFFVFLIDLFLLKKGYKDVTEGIDTQQLQ